MTVPESASFHLFHMAALLRKRIIIFGVFRRLGKLKVIYVKFNSSDVVTPTPCHNNSTAVHSNDRIAQPK